MCIHTDRMLHQGPSVSVCDAQLQTTAREVPPREDNLRELLGKREGKEIRISITLRCVGAVRRGEYLGWRKWPAIITSGMRRSLGAGPRGVPSRKTN